MAFHIHKDMIKLLDFKRKKKTGYQWFGNFAAQKKRPDAIEHPGENGDELIRPLFSLPIQRRLSPNIWRNRKGSLNHDPLIEMFDSVIISGRVT
jgi:hypothetical protein